MSSSSVPIAVSRPSLLVALTFLLALLLPAQAHAACATGSAICEEFASSAGNFQVSGGTWAVQSGAYALATAVDTGNVNSNRSVHTASVPGAFDLTVKAQAASTTSAWDDASIIFGYVDASNYFYASLNEQDDAGTNGIFRVVAGTSTELGSFSSVTTPGAYRTWRVLSQAGKVTVYRDGAQLGAATVTVPAGRVGFGSRNNPARFDDLQVLVPDATAPAAPSTLTGAGAGTGNVKLDWGAATDNVAVTGYQVLRGSTVVATLGAAVRTYTDTGLTQGNSVTHSVRAVDAAGNLGASRSVTTTVPSATPATPNASNTGVPAGTTLRVVRGNQTVPGTSLKTAANGDLTITTPGVTIDAIDLYGYVIVKAANVTIKRSRIRGSGPATSNWGMVVARDRAVSNLLLEDLTLVPDHPTYWVDGVVGHDYTARRINTYNVVDGFGVFNTTGPNANVVIESSYIHDLAFFYPDEDHSDGTHNDGVQVQGGANVRIVNNNIQAFVSPTVGTLSGPFRIRQASQGILYIQNVNAISNGHISGNLIDGGKAGITLAHTGSAGIGSLNAGYVGNNRLGRDQYDFGNGSKYPIRIHSETLVTVTGLTTNVWADNGVALAVGRDLGIRYGG